MSDLERRERHVAYFERIIDRGVADPRKRERLQQDGAYLAGLVAAMSPAMSQQVARQYRVYCLSSIPDNLLMWAHYASSHTGICLEFDTDDSLFRAASKVHYSSSFPITDMASDDWDNLIKPVLTKSIDWSYEHEYRLVSEDEGSPTLHIAGQIITRDGVLQINEGALRAVIVGCKMRPEDRRIVAEIIAASPSVALKEAIQIPHRYELSIEALAH